MKSFHSAISIQSSRDSLKPRPIYIEPWGEDYWLFPGDKFEIIATGKVSLPIFSIAENDDATEVYIEGDGQDFSVSNRGDIVECGYQRAKFAGYVEHALNIMGRGVVITSEEKWLVDLKLKDEIRLIVPRVKTLKAYVEGFQHLNTGTKEEKQNPFGLFLGKTEFKADEIESLTPVYKLEM